MDKLERAVFRPSSIERYIHCNLWRHLPHLKKSQRALDYLSERTRDHERLEQEQFKESEYNCQTHFNTIKESCLYFFKERELSMQIEGHMLNGTPDVYGYDEKGKTLYILDFKTGRYLVTATNNTQLLAYAMLATTVHYDWDVQTISLSILNTQSDRVSVYDMQGLDEVNDLRKKIEASLSKNEQGLSFGSPGNWCQFCPSKSYCPRIRDYTRLKDYGDLDTDSLILEMKNRNKEIEERKQAIKDGAHSNVLSPCVQERKRLFWKENIPEKFFTLKPMSINEAQRAFSKEEVDGWIEQRIFKVLSL